MLVLVQLLPSLILSLALVLYFRQVVAMGGGPPADCAVLNEAMSGKARGSLLPPCAVRSRGACPHPS